MGVKFRRPGIFLKSILYLLMFELALPYPVIMSRATGSPSGGIAMSPFLYGHAGGGAAATPDRGAPVVPIVPNAKPFAKTLSKNVEGALADPLIETLRSMPEIPFSMGLSKDDPSLDEDPFFLRSQKWVESDSELPPDEKLSDDDETVNQIAFRATSKKMALQIRGKSLQWELSAPLHPVYFTGDYVVLAANDESFFARTLDKGLPGEGLFLVLFEELYNAQAKRDRVPVYFLPLPESGWAGNVETLAFSAQSLVVVADNTGDTLPLQEEDIQTVVWAEKLTLSLAMGAAARHAALSGEAGEILPLPKSTAGFGMLFTGFDPARAGWDLFPQGEHQARWLQPVRDVLGQLLGKAALAADGVDPVAAANQKLVKNLIRVATVTGVAFLAAVVLKYTLYREHFRKKHAGEPRPGFWGRIKRQFTDVGDIFAHNLTVLSNIAKVWFGNSVEFIIDRNFPSLGAGKNSLLRKFLDKTVYFARDTGERLPVNTRTLLLGTGVLGMVDSGLVAVQLYFVVPWIAQMVAAGIPELKDRVDAAFDIGSPNASTYNRNEVVRNLAAYIAAGASSFSGDLKSQLIVMLGPEVDEELRKRGLDPASPRVKPVRDARMNELLAEVEKQMGLPGKDEFLFDATTLWEYGRKLLGYSTVEELKKATAEGVKADTFQGEKRPGLLQPSVKRALKEAKKRLAADPMNTALQSAVAILEQTSSDLSYIGSYVKYPATYLIDKLRGRGPPSVKELAQRIRRTRQNLLALTYDGPIGTDLKHIPSEWTKVFGESGARLASEFFRYSFWSYLSGDKGLIQGPTDVQRVAVAEHASKFDREAIDELKARYPEEFMAWIARLDNDTGRAETRLAHEHRAEKRLIVDEKILTRAEAAAESAVPYKPKRKGWFIRWQERTAKDRAHARFLARFGKAYNAETATAGEARAWATYYAEAMMNQVGLYPDYEAVPKLREKVEQKADTLTESQLKDPKVRKFMEGLSPEEKLDFAAGIYAENLTMSYRDTVVNSPASEIPALSTAQPGRLQWLRQTRRVRNSRLLTRFIRAFEAMFPVEAHRAGLMAAAQRNLPGLYDLMIGNLRTYRNAVTSATAVYWFNYFIWGVALPLPLWILNNLFFGFMIASPSQFMTRFFRMQGMQPMGKVGSMALYAFIYSWVTFWGSFPTLFLADDFTKLVHSLQGAVSQTAHAGTKAVVDTCSKVIAGKP